MDTTTTEKIQEIGYSDDLEDIIESTGGQVYSADQTEEIKQDVKNFSNKKVNQKKQVADYFIIVALLVFLSEVGYRKIRGKK